MNEIHDSADRRVDATPDAVFDVITDIGGLPDWNAAIERVIEAPPELAPGAEWTVRMHPARFVSWNSRSTVEEIDRSRLVFSYRTVNANGNPSYTVWRWEIAPSGAAARVTVSWDVYLKTIDRRLLAGPIRKRQLRTEVTASLRGIGQAARYGQRSR